MKDTTETMVWLNKMGYNKGETATAKTYFRHDHPKYTEISFLDFFGDRVVLIFRSDGSFFRPGDDDGRTANLVGSTGLPQG